jgi:putative ABC transport system permease protein
MKYLPLIWSGIWRRRGRAVLMLLQIVIAFALFGVLQGVSSGTKQAIAATHGNRLYVASKVSASDTLPISLLEQIRSIPGVRAVSPRAVFLGVYMTPEQRMPVIAVDVEPFLRIYGEMSVSPATAASTLKSMPAGALVGSELVRLYGLKVGDRFALQSPVARRDGSRVWTFDVVGVYTARGLFGAPPPTAVITNFSYVNGARADDADRSSMFIASVRDADEAGAVSLAIDNAFANSANETRTRVEGDLVSTQIQKTVDLDFIVRAVVAAAFFALLLSIGALMMRSLRERIPELAVLKAVGFSDQRILMLILAESVAFCVFAAAIGLAAGAALLPLARTFVGITRMPWIVVVGGLGCALGLAVIAGGVPALRGSRLQVVDALAGR